MRLLFFVTLRLEYGKLSIKSKASLIQGHFKCPINDNSNMEILVYTRLERDEQGRLVIAMYYKKV